LWALLSIGVGLYPSDFPQIVAFGYIGAALVGAAIAAGLDENIGLVS